MASSSPTQTHLTHTDEEKDESYGYAIQLAFSSTLPMALHSVIQLGIFEIIASGGSQVKLSCSEIAAKLATMNPDAPVMLDRILRQPPSS
ncbi:Caffeic acid 3-O-methyltransferase [Euphorbia peplus]|nr:Caffeic acid 3-O-methyltransferase [Euphorbia peplus]